MQAGKIANWWNFQIKVDQTQIRHLMPHHVWQWLPPLSSADSVALSKKGQIALGELPQHRRAHDVTLMSRESSQYMRVIFRFAKVVGGREKCRLVR